MSRELTHKIALVTGGSRGLGKTICLELAKAGARVIVNYGHNKDAAEDVVQLIRNEGGEAMAIGGDITSEREVKNLVNQVYTIYNNSIDIIVNNATGPQPEVSIEESTWELYLDQLNFFVKAPLLLTKAVLPRMKEKHSGRIINIGSDVVQQGNPHFANYVTAKSAMLGMTRSWANELGKHGITVNVVAPGFTPVERHEDVPKEAIEDYKKDIPLGRMGKPIDIAKTVVFLATSDAAFITGQHLTVNGGKTFGI